MKPWVSKLICISFVFALTSCGQKASGPANSVEMVTPAIDVGKAGTLKGVVLFSGESPKPRKLKIAGNPECSGLAHGDLYSEEVVVADGKVQNAVVYIKEGLEGYQFPIPKEPVLIDQKGCTFVPHVIAVQAHQPIELLNSDPTLHNVNAQAKNARGFNLGFPSKGMKRIATLAAAEVAVPIRCDLHPWMKGYIGVFNHPYFYVTAKDGSFSFSPLPPGKYTVEVWHETFGTQTQVIELKPQETQEIKITFILT